jgi:hypothetical protein
MNYWINSNNGDYITEDSGKYTLTLIGRKIDHIYYRQENISLTELQFKTIKGFVPIKRKKLLNNLTRWGKILYGPIYAPTLSDGTKGQPNRTNPPSVAEIREHLLKELGINE